ncbi:MAPEG family protein [Pseudomonas sp. RIT-PI-S]|uniref:MAPEG family protein n=1 Tax=Pseudomonas sp. RIT-PI-S TaxID=3035295 RepID=UPI0021D95F79|nr:MAPEG family protein [Pseudomonas sp. RIT-PI-S]
MTVAYWCVLVAILLPYLCTVTAKAAGGRYGPNANRDPRAWLDKLQGLPRRAHAAQLNGFEITPAFAAAVIIAHLAGGAEQGTLNLLALLFIVSRVVYIVCYLVDQGTMRSIAWLAGLGLIISLFCVAA